MSENGLRRVEFKDADGRLSARLIPSTAPDDAASIGVVIGPPPLAALELPPMLEIALNNELYARGLLREVDIRKHRMEAGAAVMAACRLDVERLLASLVQGEDNAS